MSVRDVIVDGLLAIGLLSFALTTLGVCWYRNLYDQIHFLAPGTLIGAVAIPAAVIVHGGFTQAGTKALLIAILLVIANPVLSHATARAARVRRKQQWPATADEVVARPRATRSEEVSE